MGLSRWTFTIIISSAALIIGAASAGAQKCAPVEWASMGRLSGHAIDSVLVRTLPPFAGGSGNKLNSLHVRTHEDVVRRQLLFEAGQPLDTLQVRESLRRLQRLAYLAEESVTVEECAGGGTSTARISVATRDSWSLLPKIKFRSSSATTIGIEEANLLGTGRRVKAYLLSDAGRLGVGMSYSDPWLLNSRASATIARDIYRDGQQWSTTIGMRETSIFDPWNAQLSASWARRASPGGLDSVARQSAGFLLSRRIAASEFGATNLLAGAEVERTDVISGLGSPIVGPNLVHRSFAGIDAGLSRRSSQFQSIAWYAGNGVTTEIPVGFQGEALLGAGRDLITSSAMLHADMWAGKIWLPRSDLLMVADTWMYGYASRRGLMGASGRVQFSSFKAASRGMWSARISAERLADPDPDVRALASADLTLRAIPQSFRLAESATAVSLERSVHLFPITRNYALDGVLLGAMSTRWEPASTSAQRIRVAVIGAGIQLAPAKPGRAAIRLDVGFPVAASASIPHRAFFGVTITPWLESGRNRSGHKVP